MSRRSRTTLTLSLTFPLPPGATHTQAVEFIKSAIYDEQKEGAINAPKLPMSSLAVNEMILKIIDRKTHYL